MKQRKVERVEIKRTSDMHRAHLPICQTRWLFCYGFRWNWHCCWERGRTRIIQTHNNNPTPIAKQQRSFPGWYKYLWMVGLFTTLHLACWRSRLMMQRPQNKLELKAPAVKAFGNSTKIKKHVQMWRGRPVRWRISHKIQFSFTNNTNLFKSKQKLDTLMSLFYFK